MNNQPEESIEQKDTCETCGLFIPKEIMCPKNNLEMNTIDADGACVGAHISSLYGGVIHVRNAKESHCGYHEAIMANRKGKTMRKTVANTLVRHDPRLCSKIKSERKTGQTAENPHTEQVVYAVVADSPEELITDSTITNLIIKNKLSGTHHTTDFLMSDTAIEDLSSIVRLRHNKYYKMAWDSTEFFHVRKSGPVQIERKEFSAIVLARINDARC